MLRADYTGAQRAAIECIDKPLQIIACAGSGKTQVISQRIAGLLGRDDVEQVPDGVLESYRKYARLLHEHAHFDYTEMINLAVGLLESDASDDTAEKLVLDHIRDDIRYVVVDES